MEWGKDNSWANSCLRKKSMSEHTAERVVRKFKDDGIYLRKYLCTHCSRWHTTTKEKQIVATKLKQEEKNNKLVAFKDISEAPMDGSSVSVLTSDMRIMKARFNGSFWVNKNGEELSGITQFKAVS